MEIHAEKRGRPAFAGRPQADRIKFCGVLCSQLLDGYGAVTREEDGFPTVAGEEQDLSVFGFPAQPPQRGGAAIIVKIGKGVIQNQRDLLLCRQHQLANGQPGGQIQLIGGVRRIVTKCNRKLKKIAQGTGIAQLTTYTARHSFATVLKRGGAKTSYISESLGHSNLTVTENYLACFEKEERIRNARLLTNFDHKM